MKAIMFLHTCLIVYGWDLLSGLELNLIMSVHLAVLTTDMKYWWSEILTGAGLYRSRASRCTDEKNEWWHIWKSKFKKPVNIIKLITAMKEGRKEMFYLTTHLTHFIYGYMASDIWLRTILTERKETRCRHMGYFPISSKGSFICTIPQTG